jgi:ribonuclease HI
MGYFKINFDGASKGNLGSSGLYGVFRDGKGYIV